MGDVAPPRLRGVEKRDLATIAELEATAFGANSLTCSALDVIFDPSGGLWLLVEDDEGVWGHSVNVRGEDPSLGWIVGMAREMLAMSVEPEVPSGPWSSMPYAAAFATQRSAIARFVFIVLAKPENSTSTSTSAAIAAASHRRRKRSFMTS